MRHGGDKKFKEGIIIMANTKRALLTSALAIVACVAMLIGSTFAWFTDTASTGVNKIQAGNLDIELQMKGNDGKWVNAEGKVLPFLVEGKIPAEGTQILWEPGCTYYVPEIRVLNKGNLAVKFEYIPEALGVTGKLAEVLDLVFDAPEEGIECDVLKPGEASPAWSFGYHMIKEAGNEYQGATATGVCVTVVATQATYEHDSFGNTYDKDATYPDVWDGTVSDDVTFTDKKAVVSTAADFAGAAKVAAANKDGDIQIDLENDLVMNAADWTSIKVDGYHGAGVLTIDGKGHTIKGLNAPLVAGGFAGSSGVVIKNLTIADSDISLPGATGVGAFVATVDSMPKITLENCHLLNSKVSGERVGGLVGWTSGYNNPNDGPVDTTVTITDCSVVGSTIAAAGSAGGIIGHAGANPATYHFITNCKVENVKLSGQYMGLLVGTANVGEVTADGNAVSGNVTKLVGRYALGSTGKVTINGEVCTDK